MAFSMSGVEDGYSYNRFDIYEKKGKKTDCPKCEDECQCDDVKEGMDPVGKEDGDVNNDGKKDSSDKYLMKRRAAIGKAMKKEEVVAEADMTGAPSIKDAKPAKKVDVKYDKKMNLMAPTIRSESMQSAYSKVYEGMKEFPAAKVQDQAAMKPDTAKGEKQARKMDKVRAVMTDKEHGMGKMAKDFNKKQPVENQKRGLEKNFAKPAHEKHKNKAYKLENQRRQDLNKRYGPKKEEFEAWLTELPDEVTIFTEEELFNIFESRISE